MVMVLGPHKKADAKVDMKAEKESKAAERAPLSRPTNVPSATPPTRTGPVAQKKERGRSENLDPEIEA